MAITFDPVNKVIGLDSFLVSTATLWSRWVDWLVLSDNLKYLPAFSQLGGVAPVPLYITLENGWKIRVQEADGTTKITGNLLVSDLSDPLTPTLGTWNTQVIIEAPLAAQAIAVNSGSGLDAAQDAALTSIKAKADQLTFTQSGNVDANIQYVNDVLVNGTGTTGDEWGP